ncbi:DUF4157 domain-containing protein [Sorangium sp. So ce296]|uniref:eCIS core domain-containing protein n=1 Tax=Sorangium sp. So ce296 TaxID=3133296 RepID=UPI003F5E0661
MFTFDRKPGPSVPHAPAPRPARQRHAQARTLPSVWDRPATSPGRPAPSGAPWSPRGRAAPEAGGVPPVTPGFLLDFTRIPVRPPPVQRTATERSPGDRIEVPAPGGAAAGELALVSDVLDSPGRPLDPVARDDMEARFGRSFSGVRVHTDERAARSAAALGARAFASDGHIIFGRGQYDPSSRGGRGLIAHELTHTIQGASAGNGVEPRASPAEVEAERVGLRVRAGLPAGAISRGTSGLALTPTGDSVKPLIAHSAFDWEVTPAEEASVLALLGADPDLSATITDLDADGVLGDLISRVDEPANRRALVQLLGRRLSPTARALVESHVRALGPDWELQFNLGRHGVTAAAAPFNRAAYASLVSSDPTAPFTGVGATGVNPTALSIPYRDQAALAVGHAATTARYTNPIPGSLPSYLASLSAVERTQQAELLLNQPISSLHASSYLGALPSRAQVIRSAAAAHNLEPALVAAFILAEQRDQSRNEDAKDYTGATSIMSGNTSIGLGQVVISTARRHDLFADLLTSTTRRALGHDQIARLLASDEYNIFAVARYIRRVANDGAAIPITSLPGTQAAFPGINMSAYANNSSTWPDDNIRALASEYTSRAWDDNLSTGWGDFVYEAYLDVRASGVF